MEDQHFVDCIRTMTPAEADGVSGLAARLGYSERQLNRVLTTELGAGPLALGGE